MRLKAPRVHPVPDDQWTDEQKALAAPTLVPILNSKWSPDRVDAEKVAVAATRCISWPRSTYCGYSNLVT
jgi:hypothetical protein